MDQSNIEIVPLEEQHFKGVIDVLNGGFGTKRCLFCFPATKTPMEFERMHKKNPLKREIAFIAIDSTSKVILGFVQLCKPGVPAFWGMHDPKEDEVYIELIAVADEARGRGIGTKLLHYSETFARNEPGIEVLTLDVLRGNQALSLYQRFGFEIVPPKGCLGNCFLSVFVFLVMGRPYGLCNPRWGLDSMVKKL